MYFTIKVDEEKQQIFTFKKVRTLYCIKIKDVATVMSPIGLWTPVLKP